MTLKSHFSQFLDARPGQLNFCAHGHHPWPDASLQAHHQAWRDAAELGNDKWQKVFSEVVPAAQHHLARLLNLPDPQTLCFAPNTHELFMRLLSSVESRPFRVLTSDSEFLSFDRQIRRLEEAGHAIVTRVPAEPWEGFAGRFAAAAAEGGHHLVYLSQVFFNSGFWVTELEPLIDAVPSARSLIVVDGYHGFMAVPTDIGRIAARAFYIGGGYKYAMSGEGAAFMHCPPGLVPRPLDTGWFAEPARSALPDTGVVGYNRDASRFAGATFDPSGLYRFNAVMDWARQHQLTPTAIRAHAVELQRSLLARISRNPHPVINATNLVPGLRHPHGNFLAFRHPRAAQTCEQLRQARVLCDVRGDRLRLGFGIYQDHADVDELARRINTLPLPD